MNKHADPTTARLRRTVIRAIGLASAMVLFTMERQEIPTFSASDIGHLLKLVRALRSHWGDTGFSPTSRGGCAGALTMIYSWLLSRNDEQMALARNVLEIGSEQCCFFLYGALGNDAPDEELEGIDARADYAVAWIEQVCVVRARTMAPSIACELISYCQRRNS